MAKHVGEIKINAYRGISELCLKDLNDINILTGDNNSGKTSVLELLSTVDNPHNIGTWVDTLRKNTGSTGRRFFYDEFFSLFPVDAEEKYVSYEYITSKEHSVTQSLKGLSGQGDPGQKHTRIELRAEIEETQIPEKEMFRLNGLMKTGYKKEEDQMVDTKCMHLEIWVDGVQKQTYPLYDFQTRISRLVEKDVSFVRTAYVSPSAHATGALSLNNILGDAEFYEIMLEMLKNFDEDILSINAVHANENSYTPEYMVLTKNHKRAMPLNVYGDGMKKALLLLSAVIEAKDGILLLDEFETAIHTSAMNPVFSWILESARNLNVQIFLTSHSKEAIEKVLKCSESLQPNINVYTLYKNKGKNLVRTMSCQDAIKAQESLGLELR